MGDNELALNSVGFWATVALAILLLNFVRAQPARGLVLAGVNLAFLAVLLGPFSLAFLFVLGFVWLCLRLGPRTAVSAAIAAAVAILFVFHKSAILKAGLDAPPVAQVLAGVGFSFLVLRAFDLLRAMAEKRYPPPTPVELVNYLVPFHMLAAGPIQAYDDFVRQPSVPGRLGTRDVVEGAERIARGLFKKFVLAYAIQTLFLTDLRSEGLYFFIEVQLLLLWLYLDFSAYSDIAVGIGRLAGIATPENFDRPLGARNLIEFWERWHISLSLFIRRNLFIPIQLWLMRRSPLPRPLLHASIATSVAFVTAGLWHGLTLGWLAWGAMHAAGLVAVRLWGYALQTRLSAARFADYRKSSLMALIGKVVTYQYVAFAFVPPFIWTQGL